MCALCWGKCKLPMGVLCWGNGVTVGGCGGGGGAVLKVLAAYVCALVCFAGVSVGSLCVCIAGVRL